MMTRSQKNPMPHIIPPLIMSYMTFLPFRSLMRTATCRDECERRYDHPLREWREAGAERWQRRHP